MGTEYRLKKNFGYWWVPEKFSLMPTPACDLLTTQQALRFWPLEGNVRFLLDNEVNGNFDDVKRKRVEARIDNPTLNPLFE